MIDLHCHLLDDTGCGPASFAESLELWRHAAQSGVRSIIATRSELIKRNGYHCAQLLFSETPAAILRTETGLISDDTAQTTHSKPFSRLRSLRLPKAIFGEP